MSESIEAKPAVKPEVSNDVWTIPNIISLIRLIMSFVVFLLIYLGGMWVTATVLFVIAVATDALDGYIARKYNQISVLGRIFDPFVDKIIIGGCFIFLQQHDSSGICPWLTLVIIGREMSITVLRGYLEKEGIDFSAQWSGKIKMILQSVAIPFCMISVPMDQTEYTAFLIARDVILYGAILVTIYSGIEYMMRGWKEIKKNHEISS